MLYGANGYTGELTARLAAQRGLRAILAGRNAADITALGAELNLPVRIGGLADPARLDALLEDVAVIVMSAFKAGRSLGYLFRLPGVAGIAKRQIHAAAPGPTDAERAQARSFLWGRVEDDAGNAAEARLQTPEGYTLTALASLLIVEKILAGQARPGYQTPSLAFGPDLVMELPGVRRRDADEQPPLT